MERLVIAYGLIGVLAVCAVGAVVYLWYNSRERTYARRQLREKKAHEAYLAKRNDQGV